VDNHEIEEPPARLITLQQAAIQPAMIILSDESYTLGRSSLCQIVARGPQISRLHARIERQGPRYNINDAGSANGTFVNGGRIFESHLLSNDDLIGLGSSEPLLRFVDPDSTLQASGALRYDERTMHFFMYTIRVELSPHQFRLLLHLYRHAGDLCLRDSCAKAMWGRDYEPGMDAGALDQAVASLRKALRQANPDADPIETRRGIGYRLTIDS
jgi:DNA-binding response OmpR family regulator